MGQSCLNIRRVILCMMHPRLLSTLVLIELVMIDEISGTPSPVLQSTVRRNSWETPSKAESYLRKAFQSWDPRALDRLVERGLGETPTALYNIQLESQSNTCLWLCYAENKYILGCLGLQTIESGPARGAGFCCRTGTLRLLCRGSRTAPSPLSR